MATFNEKGRATMKKWLNALLLIGIIAAIIGVIVTNVPKEKAAVEKDDVAYVHNIASKRATNFELPTIDGETMALTDSLGKITILNFWASWCGPCRDEAPFLQSFYENHKDEVDLLAINVTTKDKIANAQKFVDTYNLSFPVLLDETGDVSTMFGAFTIPTTVFLNANGEIVHEIAG